MVASIKERRIMYAVTFKFEDVQDTATLSDDMEINAVFHAGIAMGIQMLELSDIGGMMEMLAPGTFDDVLTKMDKFVKSAEISVRQI
jgi:hypothetical protein